LREGNLIIIDEISFKEVKTKNFLEVLSALGLIEDKKTKKALFVDSLDNTNLILSSRNVKKAKVTNSFGVNIYDLLYHEKLVLTQSAAKELAELLDPAKEKSDVKEAA
jgi:large subunit ribosomal protein L4